MVTLLYFLATITAFIILIGRQKKYSRTIFEPGVVIIGLFSLCYLLPGTAMALGVELWPEIDYSINENISLYGIVFISGFVFFYVSMSNVFRLRIFPAKSLNINWSPGTCFIGFILTFGITQIILSSYGIGDSGNYAAQYVERAAMPLMVQQLLNLLNPMQMMLISMTLVSSFANSNRKQSMKFVWLIFFIVLGEMWISNSRSHFVSLLFVSTAVYMLYRRPIGLKKEMLISIFLIVLLGVFSLKRLEPGTSINLNFISVLIPGEFAIIHHNAMYLLSLTEVPQPPGSSYIQSLIAFIPSQINASKWDLATWYIGTYFPEYGRQGGGRAFGIIPEAIVNWGLISIVFQSFIIAATFRLAYYSACRAQLFRSAFGAQQYKIDVRVLFYLYCILNIYQIIRSHSFAIFVGLILGFVIPFLAIYFLSQFFKNVHNITPNSNT